MQRPVRILVVAALAALLAGCAADRVAEPTPAPSFTSEAEAFAAADATYRAYVDALNQVDLSDPETFEAVYAWTTGEANAEERKNLTRMHADGWQVTGDTAVVGVFQDEAPASILACVDVTGITVIDSRGESQVSPDRPGQYAIVITVANGASPTGLVIATSNAVESKQCG